LAAKFGLESLIGNNLWLSAEPTVRAKASKLISALKLNDGRKRPNVFLQFRLFYIFLDAQIVLDITRPYIYKPFKELLDGEFKKGEGEILGEQEACLVQLDALRALDTLARSTSGKLYFI
jgi:hypothetical protein